MKMKFSKISAANKSINQFSKEIFVSEVRGEDAERMLEIMNRTIDCKQSYLVSGSSSTGMVTRRNI